jgi:hypothetical protein
VPDRKSAFFASDHLPGWRAALLRGWVWLRLCVRKNPGYATAALAGSLGLVLAVVLLLRGGGTSLLVADAAKSVADDDDASAELGEPDELEFSAGVSRPSLGVSDDDLDYLSGDVGVGGGVGSMRLSKSASPDDDAADDPFADTADTAVAPSRPYRRRPTLVDADPPMQDEDSDDEAGPAVSKTLVLPGDTGRVEKSDPEDDEAQTADDTPLIADLRIPPSDDADDAEKGPTDRIPETPAHKSRGRIFIPEEDIPSDDDDEPLIANTKPASAGGAPGTADTRPAATATDVADDVDAGEVSNSDEPPIVGDSRPRTSWQNSTTRPARAQPTPPLPLAEQSDEVQTTIHAVPEESVGRGEIEPAAASAPEAAAPLKLQVHAPSRIVAGQSVELEFLVVNLGDAPARDVLLSVYLPDGLTHALGPELERPIAHIAAHELQRLRLSVKATSDGPFKLKADLATGGRAGAKLSATIGAGRVASSASRLSGDCRGAPLR